METKIVIKTCHKYTCDICDYIASKKSSLDAHLLTAKHLKMSNGNENSKKNLQKYTCEICDYDTRHKHHMDAHLLSAKHLKTCIGNKKCKNSNENLQNHSCDICNKKYNSKGGLWKHQKKCEAIMDESDGITTQMFCDMLKQNNEFKALIIQKDLEAKQKDSEFKELIVEQNSQIVEQNSQIVEQNNKLIELVASKSAITNNTISNNCNNNNNFNLQFFLNDTCKDALNISDFINQLQIGVSDLEETGKLGYVEGISKIFINGLNQVETNLRPMHCSDSKREIIYIKNNNIWEKDNENKDLLTNAIKTVAHKNMAQIGIWAKQYPECMNSNSKYNNKYLDIVSNAMAGATLEETGKNYKKIAKNIAKETIICKM